MIDLSAVNDAAPTSVNGTPSTCRTCATVSVDAASRATRPPRSCLGSSDRSKGSTSTKTSGTWPWCPFKMSARCGPCGTVRREIRGVTTTLPSARPSPTRARAWGTSSSGKVRSMWMRRSPAMHRAATGSKWAGPAVQRGLPAAVR